MNAFRDKGVLKSVLVERGGGVMIVFSQPGFSGTVQGDLESLPNGKESARRRQGVGKEIIK